MQIELLKIEDVNEDVQNQISALFAQLSPGKKQLALHRILRPENQITLAYCMENDKIIGIASMCHYQITSGNKAWIEDVVVDNNARGKGIGRRLMEKLLQVAKEKNTTEVLLFTEDHRVSAINLYKKLGFKLKETRIYSLKKS